MDKGQASQVVQNAGMTPRNVAHSIYLATVEGVSGANQHEGFGFALSAIAELWNIRGSIGNPYGRTKITGRYRGMGVTEDMILNVVSRYPHGLRDNEPLFDDLLGVGSSGRPAGGGQVRGTDTGSRQNSSDNAIVIAGVLFIILKLLMGRGWIFSILVTLAVAAMIESLSGRGR